MGIGDLQVRYAAAQEAQRQARMARAWQAYYGEMAPALKVRPGETDDNVRLNFARLVVDKGVSFLFGPGVEFVVEDGVQGFGSSGVQGVAPEADGTDGERPDAQAWLDAAWEANRKATLLHKLAVNGGVCGHAWVKLMPGAAPGSPPRVLPLDPQHVTVLWEPDDFEQVVEYRLEWHGVDPSTGRPAAFRQVVARQGAAGSRPAWTVTDLVSEDERTNWRTVRQVRWPWEWPPLLGCQNLPAPNEYWGISDLETDLLDVLRSINFTMSNVARILKHHAHPRTWAKGIGRMDVLAPVDGVFYLPTKDSELGSLEMQSDLGSSLEFYKRLKEALHEMARIPEVATGKVEHLGPLSGTALQVLYQPLIEKTQTKRLLYGDLLADLNRRMLAMGGFGGTRAEVRWGEMVRDEGMRR